MKRLFVSLLFVLITSACATKTPEQYTQDKPLYEHAMSLYEKRDYTDAIPFFESLRNRFPRSPYATDAELKIADSHFEKREYLEAESGYLTFRSLHPTHRKTPYVLFRLGLTHFKRIPGSIDRDQTHTEQAIEVFREFSSRFPDAKEVPEAKNLTKKAKRMLAERELYVANFYMNQKAYQAVTIRLEPLRDNEEFKDLQAEAAYKLGYAYWKLDKVDRARTSLTEAAQNPKAGRYSQRAKKLLNKIKP